MGQHRQDSSIYPEFTEYIKNTLSKNRARLSSAIIFQYMKLAINSVLHGNSITVRKDVAIRFIHVPMSESKNHPGYKFKSSLTSDWIFILQISGGMFSKFRYRYYPSKKIKKQIQEFIDSPEVYKMIRL